MTRAALVKNGHVAVNSDGSVVSLDSDAESCECCEIVGACCLPDGSCESLTADACLAAGGVWRGAGTECGANTCNDCGDLCAPTGPQLVVGGGFTNAGGVSVSRIAVWDGTQWRDLGGGFNGPVLALCSVDGVLYAAGSFTLALGYGKCPSRPCLRIAKWVCNHWEQIGPGSDNPEFPAGVDGTVHSLCEVTNFEGRKVLAMGGAFNSVAGTFDQLGRHAIYDPLTNNFTSPSGNNYDNIVYTVAQRNMFLPVEDADLSVGDGVIGGVFLTNGFAGERNRLARFYTGNQVLDLNNNPSHVGANGEVRAAMHSALGVPFSNDATDTIVIGGAFTSVIGTQVKRIVRMKTENAPGSGFEIEFAGASSIGLGFNNGSVMGMHYLKQQERLYIVGTFTQLGSGAACNRIAHSAFAEQAPVAHGTGVNGPCNCVASLGGFVFVGGLFSGDGSLTLNNICQLVGLTGKAALGTGVTGGPVFALAAHDFGDPNAALV
jgi:hypothetical protein